MGCTTCNGNNFSSASILGYSPYSTQRTITENCNITKEMLLVWRGALNCLKSSGKYTLVNMNLHEVNRYLGLVQSGLNYPDDYCFYQDRIINFQTIILPLIVTNVPECL